MKLKLVSWGFGQKVKISELNDAIKSVFDGKNCPCLTGVTHYCAVVVSAGPITQELADEVWDYFEIKKDPEKPDPHNELVDWEIEDKDSVSRREFFRWIRKNPIAFFVRLLSGK